MTDVSNPFKESIVRVVIKEVDSIGSIPVETVVDTDLLQTMMEEVRQCNMAHGWYETNPNVQVFIEWLATQGMFMTNEEHDKVAAQLRDLFGSRTFGDDIALMHSELSEALEAHREHGNAELVRFTSADGYSVLPRDDQNVLAWQKAGQVGKPEGVASELADELVRLLDTCARMGVDLFQAFREKMDYNWTRPYRHGGKRL